MAGKIIGDVLRGRVFGQIEIADYIENKPYIPQKTLGWLPWKAEGSYLATAQIEFRNGTLTLIPEAPRGARGDSPIGDIHGAFPVNIPHYPQTATVWAESVRGVRETGSELELAFETERNKVLDSLHNRHLLRWEYAAVSAIMGFVYETNAAGQSVIRTNWFTTFGQSQHVVELDLDNASTEVVQELIDIKSLSEDELGEFDASEYLLICGRNFFKKLSGHPDLKAAYNRWNNGEFLRADNRIGFSIASNITAVEYGRGKIGGTYLIDPDTAYLCPIVDGMYQTRYAPAPGTDTLGQVGVPEYFATKVLDYNEGVEIKASTSVLSYTQRPKAIIKVILKQP